MAAKIRLMRMGRKKRPFYRIVVADSKARRDGAFVDILGYYNPLTVPADVKIDGEKALKWLGVGALPTDTTRNLFSKAGIMRKHTESKIKTKSN
ncbi:MAG: 30S ribosomal protein S16 [Deferribacteraceae bacterium]|nr:30S ribosomal protein S16 [Deferribacteraceae bacterium]